MSPGPMLRPSRGQVQSQYDRAKHMATYEHRLGLVLRGGRLTLLIANIVVSAAVLILSQALSDKHYKLMGVIAAALIAAFSAAAALMTPTRAADAYELENAWLRHRDVVQGLLDHLDDQDLTNADAHEFYADVVKTRTQLEDRGIKAIREEPAKLPTVQGSPATAGLGIAPSSSEDAIDGSTDTAPVQR
jgi:hypothetical protein